MLNQYILHLQIMTKFQIWSLPSSK